MYGRFASVIFGMSLKPLDSGLIDSFSCLEPDVIGYNRAGRSTRRRAFGAFRLKGSHFSVAEELRGRFNSRRPFHTEYRDPAPKPLGNDLLASGAVERLLAEVTPSLPIPVEDYAIGINLIRVTADDDRMGSPAPGLHQDGYDFSCHFAVSRINAAGGASIVSTSRDEDGVIAEKILQPGEFLFFDDRTLYHTATAVTCRIGGRPAHRDMVILDFLPLDG